MPLLLADSLIQRIAAVPVGYLVLWIALAVVSAGLVVLMRSRWGQSRLVHKCAMLSLLVHVLLACLAMTIKIVVGDGGPTAGPPIRVRLVDDVPPVEVAMVDPPPLLEQPAETSPVDEEAPAPDEPPPIADEPPEAGVEDAPARTSDPVLAETPPPVDEPAQEPESPTDRLANATPPAPPEPSTEDLAPLAPIEPLAAEPAKAVPVEPPPPEPVPVEAPAPVATTPVAASPYAQRTYPDRLRLVEEQGGSQETEAAVAAALDWLATVQSADGRWNAGRFGAGREQVVLGQNRYGAGAHADTGVSGLALLAFLGAGHTHREGSYQHTVQRGLNFLMRNQADDGSLFGDAELYAQMYCHSMATFALAEALAMTGDRRLEPAVRRAIGFSLRAQHPATGGWRYRVGDTGDTSQLGWQTMALWSARRGGVDVPSRTWTGIERFLRSVRRGEAGGLAAYRPDGPPSTSMTAEALYCQVLLAETFDGKVDEAPAGEATRRLLAMPPTAERINLYYWYYATLALHHRQQADPQAAAAWQTWNSALTDVLLTAQTADGPDSGSWSPDTVWGGYGGRVYSTALATLCLEVYYRYAPPPAQQEWIATRPGQWHSAR